MQAQVKEEYLAIRRELTEIKNCMTTYIGFVIGGSGLAFYLIFSSPAFGESKSLLSILFSLLALIILLVLVVLMYKFNSHNRFAGYCKLLGHEKLPKKKLKGIDYIFAWERCMAELRASDQNNEALSDLVENLNVTNIDKESLKIILLASNGKSKPLDRNKTRNGLKILFDVFRWKLYSASWRFPVFITLIFYMITAICVFSSAFYFFNNLFENGVSEIGTKIFVLIWIILNLLVFHVAIYPIGKLHCLINGSATVDRFCWRFLPFRAQFLNDLGITPSYLLDDTIARTLNEIKKYIKKNKKAKGKLPDKLANFINQP